MGHWRSIKACLLLVVFLGAALFVWNHFHPMELSHFELNGIHPGPKPPPEPSPIEQEYSNIRHVPCTKTEEPIRTSICRLLKEPATFQDKCVSVSGRFLSDGLEHSLIVDDTCRGSGVRPWANEEATEQLNRVIWQGGQEPGTFNKKVTAVFTGRFLWRPDTKHDVRILEISGVKNLKVEELPAR